MADYKDVERFEGTFAPTGEHVRFKRDWGGHHFTDDECAALLAGKTISFDAKSKAGKPYVARGRLDQGEYNGHTFWGFQLGSDDPPDEFLGHRFTQEEKDSLTAGEVVHVAGLTSKKTGQMFEADLVWRDKENGNGKELKMSFS